MFVEVYRNRNSLEAIQKVYRWSMGRGSGENDEKVRQGEGLFAQES